MLGRIFKALFRFVFSPKVVSIVTSALSGQYMTAAVDLVIEAQQALEGTGGSHTAQTELRLKAPQTREERNAAKREFVLKQLKRQFPDAPVSELALALEASVTYLKKKGKL